MAQWALFGIRLCPCSPVAADSEEWAQRWFQRRQWSRWGRKVPEVSERPRLWILAVHPAGLVSSGSWLTSAPRMVGKAKDDLCLGTHTNTWMILLAHVMGAEARLPGDFGIFQGSFGRGLALLIVVLPSRGILATSGGMWGPMTLEGFCSWHPGWGGQGCCFPSLGGAWHSPHCEESSA